MLFIEFLNDVSFVRHIIDICPYVPLPLIALILLFSVMRLAVEFGNNRLVKHCI